MSIAMLAASSAWKELCQKGTEEIETDKRMSENEEQ